MGTPAFLLRANAWGQVISCEMPASFNASAIFSSLMSLRILIIS